jgi:hypothetical protein
MATGPWRRSGVKPPAAGQVLAATLALTAGWPARHALAQPWSLPDLVRSFESRGFQVATTHPRCGEPDLFGLYLRGRELIVVCPRGDQVSTLLHEGWHAVQSRCLGGHALLDVSELQRRLTRADRRDLAGLYDPGAWRREAEARLMARWPADRYFQQVDAVCPERSPVPDRSWPAP